MILLLSDIHGAHGILRKAIEVAKEAGATAVVQLGDLGLFPDTELWFRDALKDCDLPVYFVEGNHDDCSRWTLYDTVTRVWDDREFYYVPRGTVMELDGRTIAFMGGASSIDKKYRLEQNMQWDIREDINADEVARIQKNAEGKKIDMFLTHCPPGSVIDKHFNPLDKLFFGVGVDWIDPNQLIIEDMWKMMNYPPVYSGHMHRKIGGITEKAEADRGDYRILEINEVLAV
jgi:predicted phosphodiesterase